MGRVFPSRSLREAVHEKWIELHARANAGPVATKVPTVAEYATSWLSGAVKPNLAPLTYARPLARGQAPAAAPPRVLLGRPIGVTVSDIRRALRSARAQAVTEDLITKNVAALVKLPTPRSRKRRAWTSEEAWRFLEFARKENDPFYAAFVLVLMLGLRKGEVLGLVWDDIDLMSCA